MRILIAPQPLEVSLLLTPAEPERQEETARAQADGRRDISFACLRHDAPVPSSLRSLKRCAYTQTAVMPAQAGTQIASPRSRGMSDVA
jgi:hypothetical protein